jgi:hypothetical protein
MVSSSHCTLNHQIDQQNELILHSYGLMFLLVFLQLVLNQALEQAGYTKDSALTTEDFSKVCFVAIKNCFLSTTSSCSVCQHKSTVTIVQSVSSK